MPQTKTTGVRFLDLKIGDKLRLMPSTDGTPTSPQGGPETDDLCEVHALDAQDNSVLLGYGRDCRGRWWVFENHAPTYALNERLTCYTKVKRTVEPKPRRGLPKVGEIWYSDNGFDKDGVKILKADNREVTYRWVGNDVQATRLMYDPDSPHRGFLPWFSRVPRKA